MMHYPILLRYHQAMEIRHPGALGSVEKKGERIEGNEEKIRATTTNKQKKKRNIPKDTGGWERAQKTYPVFTC